MRTDRRRPSFRGPWLVTAVIGVVATAQWHARLREVQRRAEEAEHTRDEMTGAGPSRSGCASRASCTTR